LTDPGSFDDAKLFCPVSGLNATTEERQDCMIDVIYMKIPQS